MERRGRSAGLAAGINASNGREFTTTPPSAVKREPGEAEEQWRDGFDKAFAVQTQAANRPAQLPADGRLVGLLGKADRKRKLQVDTVKQGMAGLESPECLAVLSTAVYDLVRTDFYLPDDDAEEAVKSAFQDVAYEFTDADWEQWWARAGHTQVKKKAKSARYALGTAVKLALFKTHGTKESSFSGS
jgi:hypothetical protein